MSDRYVNDVFTLDDGFGTTLAGDQVARMALEVETPFTLGVTGKWGSGKTSVLRRAFATLGGSPVQLAVPLKGKAREDTGGADWKKWAYGARVEQLGWSDKLQARAGRSFCVWYSPWQHQSAENPLIPLLLEIHAQFSTWTKFKKNTSELVRRGGLAGLALLEKALGAASEIVAGTDVIGGTREVARKAWNEAGPDKPSLGDGQRFHLLFEDAVETLLDGAADKKDKQNEGRLVLFIDDLDRCEESAVVRLLEVIKLYLGSRRCVFLLAIDESAVLSAMVRHWPGRSEDANREYLEKLFQAIVPVPVPRKSEVRRFVKEQLDEHRFPDFEGCAKLLYDLLEPNPRKIKNFVNSACANWGLFQAALPKRDESPATDEKRAEFARQFLLFHYLRVQHKPVWRLLERQPWSLRVLTKVLTGTAPQAMKLPEYVQLDDQRMLEHLLFSSFAHVLKDDAGKDGFHRHLPIAEAVKLFEERIDRKRSDEVFIRHYKALIAIEMDLPDAFLYLPEVPADV